MTERDTGEESQRTETSFEETQVVGSSLIRFRFRTEGADVPDVTVNLEAEPAMATAEAGHASIGTAEILPSASERDVPVQRDDAYYSEVRQAVGGGAPTVLLGTSTKSLERSLEKLRLVQQSGLPTSSLGALIQAVRLSSTRDSRRTAIRSSMIALAVLAAIPLALLVDAPHAGQLQWWRVLIITVAGSLAAIVLTTWVDRLRSVKISRRSSDTDEARSRERTEEKQK